MDTEIGEAHYLEAWPLAEPRGMRPLVAHRQLGLGKVHRRAGRHAEAYERPTSATTMFREIDMRSWLELAEAESSRL